VLSFSRIDYPENDPPEWHKYIVIRGDGSGRVQATSRPLGFWGDYEMNYGPRHAENIAAMQGTRASTAT